MKNAFGSFVISSNNNNNNNNNNKTVNTINVVADFTTTIILSWLAGN